MDEKVVFLEDSDLEIDKLLIEKTFKIYLLNILLKEKFITKNEYLKIKVKCIK